MRLNNSFQLSWQRWKTWFEKESEFQKRLRTLLAEYGVRLREIIEILESGSRVDLSPRSSKPSRKPRKFKVFKRPQAGEVIETKGGNHKASKKWKAL